MDLNAAKVNAERIPIDAQRFALNPINYLVAPEKTDARKAIEIFGNAEISKRAVSAVWNTPDNQDPSAV